MDGTGGSSSANSGKGGNGSTGGGRKRGRVSMELSGHTHGVSDVAWARDSRLLASASDDKSVRLWDTETVRGAGWLVSCVMDWLALSCPLPQPTHHKISTNQPPTTITRQGQELSRFLGHGGYVFCLAIDPSGSLVASGAADESVRIWDIRSGGSAAAAATPIATAGAAAGAVAGGGDSGGCLRTLYAHSEPVTALDFSPDGSCLASSSYDGVM